MDTLYINLIDSEKQIPFIMTYGLHRELQQYLFEDNRIFTLLNNLEISDEVIRLCLSERNKMGQIVIPFKEIQLVEATDMLNLLNFVFDYFSDFFLKSNQKINNLSIQLNQISQQSQLS